MDATQPLWRQIADDLRAQITQGKLGPGDRVPTERDLAIQWEVARDTARQALQSLEDSGLLAGGRPRRVADYRPVTVHVARTADLTHPGESPTMGADSWVGDVLRAGQEPTQDIEVVTEAVRGKAARLLQIPGGTTVTSRRLTRLADGKPHNLITYWFPVDVARGTLLAEPPSVTEGTVAWLEKTYCPLTHTVEVSARMPGPDETRELRIPPGIPVLTVWRAGLTAQRPVMTSMAVYPAHLTILKLDL